VAVEVCNSKVCGEGGTDAGGYASGHENAAATILVEIHVTGRGLTEQEVEITIAIHVGDINATHNRESGMSESGPNVPSRLLGT